MVIHTTELYDLNYLITLIRNNIKDPLNIKVLKKAIEAVNKEVNPMPINHIRKYLSQIEDLNDPKWHFVFIENFYTQSATIIKKADINKFISDILENILRLLTVENYEQAYDLADLAHAIPQILAEFNGAITKSYWKHRIDLYRKKWDKDFLSDYQKGMTTKG